MKNDDPSRRGARPRTAAIPTAWLAGAVILAILSGSMLFGKAMPIDNSRVYDIVASGHYAISLALTFLVFAGVYFLFDAIFALSYRRGLGWGHFGLMAAGALFIASPPTVLRLTSPWPLAARAEQTFVVFSTVPTLGYLLTLVGLALFAILLGDMVVDRLRR